MSRQADTFPLVLPPRETGTTAGRWLYDALRAAILDRRLGPGVRLPATRDLARQYRLARGTVVTAFEQLRAEGYIRGKRGSGTYVNDVLPDALLVAGLPRADVRARRGDGAGLRLSDVARRTTPFSTTPLPRIRAFRANQPALDLVPTTLWAQVAGRRLRSVTIQQLMGCPPLGYAPLREAVAGYLTSARGVRCSAAQVCIVSGVQDALDLAARLLLNPGDRVAMEDPGYSGASLAFSALAAKVIGVPIDAEGMTLPPRLLRDARLVYVTPAHQFPLGVTMSLARRLALLAWARAANAVIFEDDYDSEFRYAGAPMPALQGLDEDDRVLFAGSFSKVLFPGLRLGYLVVPESLVERVEVMLSVSRRHGPVLEQAILADFIADGHFGRHVRRMREIYAQRLGVLLEEGRRHLEGLVRISDIEAGLQTVGWLAQGLNAEEVTAAAARREVQVVPLSEYAVTRQPPEALQLGFAAVDEVELKRGVRELALAVGTAGRRDGGKR
ncbi:MAG TPA: PLP-dependent aminotransferase family protein [Gemmatimonadales bacterium]|nr:PLP-dependent aminotransferase family protein [Gemmatimonadales bacterium]